MKQIIELDVSLKNTILGNNNWIRLFSNIENSILGNNIFIGFNSKIYNAEIGNNVQIASKVVIGNNSNLQKVTINKNTWIGAHAIIEPGVKIGEGVIVGAKTHVTKDVPSYSIIRGSDARENIIYPRMFSNDGSPSLGDIFTHFYQLYKLKKSISEDSSGNYITATITGKISKVGNNNILVGGKMGGIYVGINTELGNDNILEGGYWNKIDKNNKVSVDNTTSYYTFNSSPFPYKSMLDHAILVYALSKKNRNSIVYKRSLSELLRYYDLKNSGVFLGGGNWFSTPVTPTVPLARLVMVPPHTVGAFSVGNTSYLPLHEKNATVQLVSSLALKGINKIEIDYPTKIKEVSFSPLDTSLKYISSGQLTNSHIDIEKYKLWLEKTKSGFGYGLTPYQSPLGFKSDRSPQNFSAMHVISDKSVLYEEIPDKDNIFLTMKAAQNKDGGFGEQAGVVSELFTTYCVVATSFILKNKNYNIKKCLDFVKSCQNDDGGFGNAPGYPSDIWHTNFGVLILHLLNSEANFPEKLIQYLVSAQNEDGGFAVFPNLSSEVFSTFRAIDSLRLLDIEIPNKERVISWLQSMQDVNEGGFHISENKPISFVGSYHAIAALYLLDTLPINIEKIKIWFGNHQAKDGGFSKLLHHPSDTTDEGFISLHASYMLEQKINPYWIAIIT